MSELEWGLCDQYEDDARMFDEPPVFIKRGESAPVGIERRSPKPATSPIFLNRVRKTPCDDETKSLHDPPSRGGTASPLTPPSWNWGTQSPWDSGTQSPWDSGTQSPREWRTPSPGGTPPPQGGWGARSQSRGSPSPKGRRHQHNGTTSPGGAPSPRKGRGVREGESPPKKALYFINELVNVVYITPGEPVQHTLKWVDSEMKNGQLILSDGQTIQFITQHPDYTKYDPDYLSCFEGFVMEDKVVNTKMWTYDEKHHPIWLTPVKSKRLDFMGKMLLGGYDKANTLLEQSISKTETKLPHVPSEHLLYDQLMDLPDDIIKDYIGGDGVPPCPP